LPANAETSQKRERVESFSERWRAWGTSELNVDGRAGREKAIDRRPATASWCHVRNHSWTALRRATKCLDRFYPQASMVRQVRDLTNDGRVNAAEVPKKVRTDPRRRCSRARDSSSPTVAC